MSLKEYREKLRNFKSTVPVAELLKRGMPSKLVEEIVRHEYPKMTDEDRQELYLTGDHTPSSPNELLYISPDAIAEPSDKPAEDDLTKKMDFILEKTYKGEDDAKKRGFTKDVGWGYHQFMGYHVTSCGEQSESQDWYIPTKDGMWTNSLAGHYVKHYRPYIPQSEIDKIERIYNELKGVK